MTRTAQRFGLTEQDMNELRGLFLQVPSIREVRIFGSRAKGSSRPGSDVDLAVMNEVADPQDLDRLRALLEDSSLPYFVDVVDFPRLKHPELREHIERVGKLFYKA